MNALLSSIDNDKPSWLRQLVEAIVIPISSTLFEILLLGFATFFPAHLFKIEYPVLVYCQITTFSITVAFFQGCRSLGYMSYIKRLANNKQKYYRLFGAIAVIPLNLLAWLYFNSYSQNPLMAPTQVKQIQLFTIFLIGLNFAVGIWGSQRQYKAIEQELTKRPMRFLYPSIGLTFMGWFMILAVTNLIFK